jgi:YgiT-type zinc finger domain-containing protein
MVYSFAPFSADRDGYHITWESIPAWVCSQCGEVLFEEREVEQIQQALKKIDQDTKQMKLKSA